MIARAGKPMARLPAPARTLIADKNADVFVEAELGPEGQGVGPIAW